MADLDKAYEDKTSWSFFEPEDESELVGVYRRCPQCSRFLTKGQLLVNGLGRIRLTGWTCKIHGEQQPFFNRNCKD